MKRSRMIIAVAASLLAAHIATAQMGGGMHGGSGTSGGMGYGSDMMGRLLTVGADGVVYTLRGVTTTTGVPRVEVVAIRPTGTTAWTATVDGRMTRLELSGNLVLVASGNGGMGMDRGNGSTDEKSRLVALSAASGAVQWQVEIDGVAMAIEPFAGGVYALVVKWEGTTSGGTGMHRGAIGTKTVKRSLAAFDTAGKLLWTLPLN